MYNLIAIDSTAAPDGMDGQNWCRYIIGRDDSMIVGHCRGTVQQVMQHARHHVDELNARANGHVKPYRSRSTQLRSKATTKR